METMAGGGRRGRKGGGLVRFPSNNINTLTCKDNFILQTKTFFYLRYELLPWLSGGLAV